MKKKYFFLLFLPLLLLACSSEDPVSGRDDNPISNLELPKTSAENPAIVGQTIILKGKGFTSTCEIWIGETKAEINNVTDKDISFIAPEISGEQEIRLKKDGKYHHLGKMFFASQPEPEIVRKRIIKRDFSFDDDEIFIYKYDAQGRLEKITSMGPEIKPDNYDYYFSYDKDGNLSYIKDLYVDDNNSLQGEYFFEYKDKTTIVVKEIAYKGEFVSTYYFTLTLDANGRLIKKVREEDGYYQIFEYDAIGNIIKSSGELIDKPDGKIYTYDYTYDDKKSEFTNQGFPLWYWAFSLDPDYDTYPGINNVLETKENGKVFMSFQYDYDEDGYPTTVYDKLNNNKKIGEFTYEVIK